MSSSDQPQVNPQSDVGKLAAAVSSGLPSSNVMLNGPTNGQPQSMATSQDPSSLSIADATGLNFGTTDSLNYNNPTNQSLGGITLPGYSTFPSAAGDGSWTPTYDPTLLSSFSFTGAANVLTPNQYFFPSTDVWGQDHLMINSMNSNWLLSPVPLDQASVVPGTSLGVDNPVNNPLEPVSNIEQTFNGLSLNGSVLPSLNNQQIVNNNATPQNVSQADSTSVLAPTSSNPTLPQDNKPKSWAAIASQPAKPKPAPPKPVVQPQKEELGTKRQNVGRSGQGRGQQYNSSASVGITQSNFNGVRRSINKGDSSPKKLDVVSKLKSENTYNPLELTFNLNNARYFVIKSYAEDDVHRSIKYNVWCSTEHGNRRLDFAFKEQRAKGGSVYLFFSVNGSGHFCGVAQMASEVDLVNETGIWTQDKWKGKFDIKWLYVKDVPNSQLRHIRLENNENKPVTNSRDTQEVPVDKGKLVMKVIHSYNHTTSIFDDFEHYEKRQEEEGTVSVSVDASGFKKERKS